MKVIHQLSGFIEYLNRNLERNMDTDMANENNLFADEIVDNKREDIEEILIKEEIKEEFLEDQCLLPDKNEELLNSQEEKLTAHVSTETGLQNCFHRMIEFTSTNVMEVDLSQSNSEALVCNRRNREKKLQSVERPFKCSSCHYHTTHRGHLEEHIRTHTGEKPFKCSSCPYQAAEQRRLQQHMKTHSGEKPFKCSSCPYKAARMGTLQRHERTHTGEKPFRCSFCPFQAADRGSLQIHKRTHTGEKPFKCSFCTYQAADNGNLQRHQRIHTGEKPFKCGFCPYQAAQMGSLQKHKRTHK